VTVVGVKEHGKDFTYAVPETVIPPGALLVISGTVEKVERFAALT
jgi:trk system potassium uptake protein TrkA